MEGWLRARLWAQVVAGVELSIPAAALPLILGVDRILDMSRTAVNLTGDLTGCVLLSGTRGSPAGS